MRYILFVLLLSMTAFAQPSKPRKNAALTPDAQIAALRKRIATLEKDRDKALDLLDYWRPREFRPVNFRGVAIYTQDEYTKSVDAQMGALTDAYNRASAAQFKPVSVDSQTFNTEEQFVSEFNRVASEFNGLADRYNLVLTFATRVPVQVSQPIIIRERVAAPRAFNCTSSTAYNTTYTNCN